MAVPYYLNRKNGKQFIKSGFLIIPEGVIQIEEEAFAGNNEILKIIMPESLTVIEDGVFEDCTQIQKICFSKNLIDMGYSTFKNCRSLKKIDLTECKKLMTINDHCFENATALEVVLLPPVLKEIRDFAFAGCLNLMEVLVKGEVEVEPTGFMHTGVNIAMLRRQVTE
ncbi:leucine-rich repeat domain-containing protein [Eubacterium sp.]|uniref:leucine-rich repeat domain-containing protein n=1 Tax=Eubacterium sp. TaxID=142586 RepID=UPI0026DEF1C6|nr:leucine-rich repeat domain-containing protein [Eubacterium sp.]MDO5433598.1 leucine-rich repeat domain-containing protein [Eubacterium sp.]